MASQVLSGSSNVSYTNNTGQNVRIVINYMAGTSGSITMSWAGVSANSAFSAIGRNLAFMVSKLPVGGQALSNPTGITGNNAFGDNGALPTEIMLAPGQTFSASCGPYNIVVIPEAG